MFIISKGPTRNASVASLDQRYSLTDQTTPSGMAGYQAPVCQSHGHVSAVLRRIEPSDRPRAADERDALLSLVERPARWSRAAASVRCAPRRRAASNLYLPSLSSNTESKRHEMDPWSRVWMDGADSCRPMRGDVCAMPGAIRLGFGEGKR